MSFTSTVLVLSLTINAITYALLRRPATLMLLLQIPKELCPHAHLCPQPHLSDHECKCDLEHLDDHVCVCDLAHLDEHTCKCEPAHLCSEWCTLEHVAPPLLASPTDEWHAAALHYEGDCSNSFRTKRVIGNNYLNILCRDLATNADYARSNNSLRAGVLNGLVFANTNGSFYNDTTVGDWCEAALADQDEATRRRWVMAYLRKVNLLRAGL